MKKKGAGVFHTVKWGGDLAVITGNITFVL